MQTISDRFRSTRARGHALFVAEAGRDLRTTGAIASSSTSLARTLTAPIARSTKPALAILEVGAGTGALTRAIAARMGPDDALTCIERNPRLAEHLRRMCATDPAFRDHRDRIDVRDTDIVELAAPHPYDVVVAGLPFANFTEHETRAVCETLDSVLEPGGWMTYFSYLGGGVVDRLSGDRYRRQRHGSAQVLAEFRARYRQERVSVWRNLPPAHAWILRKPATSDDGRAVSGYSPMRRGLATRDHRVVTTAEHTDESR